MVYFTSHSKTDISQHTSNLSQRELPLRAMIVDDHEIFRHGLRDLINGIQGFRVVAEARSSTEALTVAESTALDLIFMDLSLPDENGLAATYQLKQLASSPSIIILSATMTNDTLLDAILTGADGYLTKDIPATEIINILQGFLQGAPAMLPPVANHLIHQLVKKCTELSWRCDSLEAELILYDLNDAKLKESAVPHTTFSGKPALAGPSTSALHILTPQEERVFQLMRQGHSNKNIAAQLSISHYTVGKHVQNILRKLRVKNRTQAASSTSFEGGERAEND